MRFKLLKTRMHGVLHKTMHHKTQLILGEIGSDLGQLHDVSFSLNCRWELSHEKVSDKENLSWISFAEKHL